MESVYQTNMIAPSQLTQQGGIDSYTKLCIHCEGPDSGTTFPDESESAHTVTANGTAILSWAQSKFGASSCLLDGNSDYLQVGDSTDFFMDTDNFTIDLWVRWNTLPASAGTQCLIAQHEDADNYAALYLKNTAGVYKLWFWIEVADAEKVSLSATVTPVINTWYHVAIVRNSTNFKIYLDGTQVATATDADAWPNFAGDLYIGSFGGSSLFLHGWVDEIRVSNGSARWTANFTPPTWAYKKLTAS